MSDHPEERRRHRRVELRVPVTVLGAPDQPTTRDLSLGGMFIETAVAHPIGVILPVRLVHPDTGEVIPAVCQVVRQVHDDAGRLVGLGLRFANTDESLGERIGNLLFDLVEDGSAEVREEDVERDADDEPTDGEPALAVVEFDEPEITWESETQGDEAVDVLVVEADGADTEPAAPIIWPDTRPEKIPGALRHGLTPMQLRLLPFVDGNNTVEEIAAGTSLGLETILGELSELARRAVVRIPTQPTTDDDLDAWEKSTEAASESQTAKPLFPGRAEHAEEQERWRRARNLVTQGLAAARNDELDDAVSFLEQALELNPPNAANIHARLAILGMELGDLDLAERHARAVQSAEPHRPHGPRLLRRIKRLRIRGVKRPKPKTKPKKPPPRRRPTQQSKKGSDKPRRRTVLALLMLLAIVGLVGWNIYHYLVPMLDAPPHLDVKPLASFVPALEARLRDRKLIVTVSPTWETLTAMEKTDALERLAAWARNAHGINEVVVADQTPLLRGRVRGTEVEIFGTP